MVSEMSNSCELFYRICHIAMGGMLSVHRSTNVLKSFFSLGCGRVVLGALELSLCWKYVRVELGEMHNTEATLVSSSCLGFVQCQKKCARQNGLKTIDTFLYLLFEFCTKSDGHYPVFAM